MTARFFRREISWDEYRAATGLVSPPPHEGKEVQPPAAEYNIAPSQIVPILRRSAPGLYVGDYAPRESMIIAPAFWGLVPVWWDKPLAEKKFSTFNARAETIAESNTFSGAFRQGRCLVPASGFYAWSGQKGASTPFAFALTSGAWFCFAGLWSRWMYDGAEIDTFTIITCEPNLAVAAFSTSMPVILEPGDYARWLDTSMHGGSRGGEALLRPCPADALRAWPANPAVGNVRNQGAGLLGE